jgi:hypothetical protein
MAYDVSRLQKRARDKEYRLRKQGANREAIAAISPRKPWAEIKSMTPVQLRAYAKRLDAWNRKTRYTGVKSGNVIPTKLIDQAKRLQQKRNQFIYSERERIRGIAPSEWDKYYRNREGILASYEDIVGLLAPIDVEKMEPPESVQVAHRRIKRFEERNKHKFSYYRGLQRSAMEKMLWKLDQYELAEVVHQMDKDAFDLLSTVYASWDTLKYEYNPKGEYVTFEDPYGQFRSYVERALSITQGKDMITIQKNMERVAGRRADRARERAKAAGVL